MASSVTDLMHEYHRLAADALLGGESNNVAVAILEAAEVLNPIIHSLTTFIYL
jgi:hypothetical protein